MKLAVFSLFLAVLFIGMFAYQVKALNSTRCDVGDYYVAGICYGKCNAGDARLPTGKCKAKNGTQYDPSKSKANI